MSRAVSYETVNFTLDLTAILCYCGNLSAKNISSCEWICPQSLRLPVHFFVMSIIARYSIFKRLSSVGNTLLFFVTLRSCRLNSVLFRSFLIISDMPRLCIDILCHCVTLLLANCHIFVSTDTPYLCIILFSYCRAFQQ